MAKYFTNGDRILQAVLGDNKLSDYAKYDQDDFETIAEALDSDNPIVFVIAKIIDGSEHKLSEKEIYNEVSNYLKQSI